ncbi:hypothetical protein BAE44_0014590 [Dichanthelium oligosanthes]|uniref:Disease resistance N-terminal domain-containing protein n=1 Tax=Dichanthelium oligosanthes TaxID=888268 RepID=A0A1E5VGY5_9POAL|nr:hypothetical protein BAE44_0014590 [Dichanthelium oligosanthes]
MEVVLSAVASDLVGRLISFLIGKYQERGATEDDAARLQRALLRARAVVEEAEGRQIANQAMLLQLNQLRREMFRGAYELDALSLRRRATASKTFSLPLSTGGLSVVESLESALSDMTEFVVLLGGYPRVPRQPYNAYLHGELHVWEAGGEGVDHLLPAPTCSRLGCASDN